jgi:V/A-type H+-transporting ATPase subunit E
MLEKTDSECEKLIASVESDIEKAAKEKQLFFAHKLEAFEKDRMAVVPLEKERFKVSFIQNAIIQNINKYLEGLSEEKRLELASRNFDFKKAEHKVNAKVYGFSLDSAKSFLSKKLGDKLLSCAQTKFSAEVYEEDLGLAEPQGIILETEDKNFRSRLTLNEVIEKLLDANRSELSDTLFGGQI